MKIIYHIIKHNPGFLIVKTERANYRIEKICMKTVKNLKDVNFENIVFHFASQEIKYHNILKDKNLVKYIQNINFLRNTKNGNPTMEPFKLNELEIVAKFYNKITLEQVKDILPEEFI